MQCSNANSIACWSTLCEPAATIRQDNLGLELAPANGIDVPGAWGVCGEGIPPLIPVNGNGLPLISTHRGSPQETLNPNYLTPQICLLTTFLFANSAVIMIRFTIPSHNPRPFWFKRFLPFEAKTLVSETDASK